MQGTRKGLIYEIQKTITSLSKFDENVSQTVSVTGLIGDLEETIHELKIEEDTN